MSCFSELDALPSSIIGGGADHLRAVEFLVNMSASADVLAMAKVEVDLNAIPEGKNVSLQ